MMNEFEVHAYVPGGVGHIAHRILAYSSYAAQRAVLPGKQVY
jgi:hypothetical protein